MKDTLIWSDELLLQLRRAGIEVNTSMIHEDVRRGYLPPPRIQPRSPIRGRSGKWDRIAVRRAFYLYRLRERGARGDVLRILLFLRDGWGWERIQPICLIGLRKVIGVPQSQIKDHIYSPITPEILEFYVDDISKDAMIQHVELGRFVFGMGTFGKPSEGGSLGPLWRLLSEELAFTLPYSVELIEQRIIDAGLTWEDMIRELEGANAEQVERAREGCLGLVQFMRILINNSCLQTGIHPCWSNVLTLGGKSTKALTPNFRTLPGRITPGQLLGAMIGIGVVAARVFPDLPSAF